MLAADSEKPSDSSHEWRRPNVMASVASSKFCVKSSQGYSAILSLNLRWTEGQLGWYDPNTGEHIPTLDDAEARANAAEARVRELENQLRQLDGE